MAFSEEAAQQRRREAQKLRRFVGISVAGSLLAHGLLVSLPVDQQNASQPRRIEIAVVPPRPSPSPVPPIEPPAIEPTPTPERIQRPVESRLDESRPDESRPVIPETATPSQATNLPPEGSPDATVNESPLVGSGLAPGTGGFSEGIGLNQSDSPIRGEGGGNRQGVPGGAPGGSTIPQPAPEPDVTATAPTPPRPPAPPVAIDRASRQIVCRRCPEPDYPRSALRAGIEGRPQFVADVDRRGRITNVRLIQSSGNAAIDRAALATVRERWRFEAVEGGATNVPIEFFMTVSDSELNQRAQEWGDRTAVSVPTGGFAAPTPQTPAAARPTPASDRPVEAEEDRSQPTPTATPTPEPEVTEVEPQSTPAATPIPEAEAETPEPSRQETSPPVAPVQTQPEAQRDPEPPEPEQPMPEARPEPRPTPEREPVREPQPEPSGDDSSPVISEQEDE